MGRKAFRTSAEKELVKDISSLATRLTKRLANVEKRGLANVFSSEARELDLSTRGKSYRELLTLRRQIKQKLRQRSTSVKGAKETVKVWHTIQQTIDLPTKEERKKVDELLSKAYEMYETFRDRNYRYQIREVINKLVSENEDDAIILENIKHLADELSGKNGEVNYELAREAILK